MAMTSEEKKARQREYNRQYRQENRERLLAQMKEYRQENRERLREQQREYYQETHERRLEWRKGYYQENRERILEQKKEYRQENRERILERQKEYQQQRRAAWDAWFVAQGRHVCVACGYSEDFRNVHEHHISAQGKAFNPAEFYAHRPFTPENVAELEVELQKCIPLCAHCHSGIHSKKRAAQVVKAIQDRFVANLATAMFFAAQAQEPAAKAA